MEINVRDYLSEEEMKEIAKQTFKGLVIDHFKSGKSTLDKNIERVISNAAYDTIYKTVDELLGDDSKKLLAKKIAKQIETFSAFNLFDKPDAWCKETNGAYDHLQQTLVECKPIVESVVREHIGDEAMKLLRNDLPHIISDAIVDHFKDKD